MTTKTLKTVLIASLFPLIVCLQTNLAQSPDSTVDQSLLPTGRSIQPAGEIVTFTGRPVDLQLDQTGQWLLVKDRSALRVIDTETWKVVQTIKSPDGASQWGLAVAADNRVYFTDSKSGLVVFAPIENGADNVNDAKPFHLERTIKLPVGSYPCGVKISNDQKQAFVCLSKKNSVAIVDLAQGKILETIDVGVAPFDLVIDSENGITGDQLFVSNLGGRRPVADDKTAPSAGTPTVVDKRGIASTGTVSQIDLKTKSVTQQFDVGRHPSVLENTVAESSMSAVVCNTNDDSISFLSPDQKPTTLTVKPDPNLPFGSMPSAIRWLPKQSSYAVALAGNNAIAWVRPATDSSPLVIQGLIPTAWYPVAIQHDEEFLYVACAKGLGARAEVRKPEKGHNSHDNLGTVQRIRLTEIADAKQLAAWTKQVHSLSRIDRISEIAQSRAANGDAQGAKKTAPVPVPVKLGQPSHFKHVIYVIKENRTFDQVFGDLKEARSEPDLCIFPETITPNHHALAKRFGILDNYYCNGVLSADGHSWATEGNVTPYLERSFGGFARSYTFGDDPITYSSSGFLWDHFLDAGFSFRNYGEFDYAKPPKGMKYQQIWDAYSAGEPIEFTQNIGVDRVRRYSCRDYPGWNMQIPDVVRMDRFLKEFREFEENDGLPNLTLVYLPQDHLGGGVTSEAHMADNDLALGRLVEAVSHSKFWKETVIFVNEDDPQNGYDHIDGHRSLCLVISPYSKQGVNHSFYNQTSALRTMLHLFGLPPMNQQDASAPLMTDCFQAVADLTPYDTLDANIPLNQTSKPAAEQSLLEKHWREILKTVPIERTGMKTETDEDHLNRFVWHDIKGWTTPYPIQWAGPHARGLKRLGLILDTNSND